ncbi:phage tail protein [Vagococcus carniphilus]|uniref:phage tail protein n=1 Tax=Vagococcus carniphilus TaxID=218144 RepID=UPI003BA8879D
MELETLEIFIEANVEKMEEQFQRILPLVERVMGGVERTTGQSISKTEKNMDVEKGVNTMSKQFEQMTKMYEKQMEMMEKITTSSTANIDKGLSKGFGTARKTVNKDVDQLVKDINAKMGRAKAEQEKLAFLQAQRQDASTKGDKKNVVKYDSQIARAQEMMDKYQGSAKQMADSIKNEFKSLPHSLEAMSKEMQKNESVIEGQKAKVRELTTLYEQQAKKVSKLQPKQLTNLYQKYGNTFDPGYQKEVKQAGFKFEDTKSSKKTGAEITKYNKEIQKLVAKNDTLQRSYSEAEDRTKQLRSAVKGLNTELGKSSVQTGNAALGAKKIGQGAEKSKSLFSKFGGVFNRTSNNIAHGSRRMTTGIGGFSHRLGQMVKQAFIFSVIYKGLQLVSRGLGSALMANDEFSNSLNQIKVNLLTAFYPIYTFILPAINALMRALTVVTGQIAHFTASLFGTTYTAAKAGAQGLYQNVQAMNDSGNAADKNREKVKKLQRSLMGFDEINRIGLDDDEKDDDIKLDDNKNNVNFNTPVPAMPDWINKANGILRDFFKPFQDSWAKHGQKVIDAWKYALGEVIELSKSIGRSFMEVWTNGTGEKFISNILILLATMLNIVGDIAKAFRLAWDENDRGTKLIQSAFDALNSILELANEIGNSFRDAWAENQIGISIFGNLLEIMTNTNDIVSNLATGLKEAWVEGGVGQSIFSTLLTMVNDMLEALNRMTEATAKWAKKLDFTPLLESIDGLLKSIEPLTKNVFDGIAWFYENVLLPLAGFTITEVIPNFLDLLSGAIDVVNSVIEALKPLGEWLWGSFLQPMAEWTGGVIVDVLGNVADGLKGISEWIDNNQSKIETLAVIVGSFAAAWGLVNIAMGIWNVVGGIAAGVTTVLAGAVAFLTSPITLTVLAIGSLIALGVLLYKNWDEIIAKAGELGSWIGEKWDGVKTATKETWDNVKEKTKETWDNVSTKVKTKTSEAWTNTKEKWENIKKSTTDRFEEVRKTAVEKWDKVKDKVTTASSNARTNASNAWSTMKTNISGYNDTIKTKTSKAFDAVKGWASKLGGELGNKLTKGKEAVVKGAKNIGKGIYEFPMKAINGMIKGVAWVLDLVGAKDTAKSMKEYTFKYAQGTGYHPGGMALVNDGYGSNFREAYQLPNGQTGLFPNKRNLMVDLPAGSSVLSGPRTASMYGDMPAYAGGVGKWIKNKWEGVKEFTGDVWDYMSEPSKLVEAGISKFANLKGAIEPALSISQGAIATSMDAATSFVKNKMEELFDSGDADTSATGTMGVMQYLSDIASDVMKKFPGMVATSGYRHGDPYSHGKRQAIDIAYPSGMNGSSQYFEPANYAFNKFRDKVAYVITQGKVRDRTGMSGTGSSGQWRHWPDNDHYDHLHINGSIAQGQGGPKATGGSGGAGGWRGQIIRASNMMRANASASEVNGILAQIQRESGGNQNIVQSSAVWDVNMASGNPARGLLQYIPSTFNHYKVRGFGNIMNGFHQLMAFFNNSRWRSDLPYGRSGWGPSGYPIKPYAKGTPYVPEDQLAMIHKGEMIVPAKFNPNNSMANFQTLQMPEIFRKEPQPVTYVHVPENNNVGGGMSGATEGIVNAVMMALSMRDSNSDKGGDINITLELEGEKVAKVVVDEVNKQTKRQGKSPILI